jgi:ABC-type multidrug transport system fused ATPase/permease subunit
VFPFLVLIADPGRASYFPLLQDFFLALGWQDQSDLLLPTAAIFALAVLTAATLRLALVWIEQKFIFRLSHDLATEVYRRTLHQPYSYHVSQNESELVGAIFLVHSATFGVLLSLLRMATAIIASAFVLAALLAINAAVALGTTLGFGAVYLIVSLLVRGRLRANSRTIAASVGRRVHAAHEGLGGIRDVLLDQAQHVYVGKFQRADLAYADAQTLNVMFGTAPRFFAEAAGMVLIAILAVLLSRSEGGLAYALPTLGALALAAQRLLPLIQQFYQGWTQINGNREALLIVLGYLDLPIPSGTGRCPVNSPLRFDREISLHRLGFQYEAKHPRVLDRIDLRICKGERVALIGKTGSGKSTLTDIIMGLLQPTDGEVRVDGIALTAENISSWQVHIAHVPQAIYLSDSTIAENIAFAIDKREIDMTRVRAAARSAHIAEFIEALPVTYDTEVGDRGVRLSGGQRQRIGIARALYRRASLLILDEATSALDLETEAAVMDAIRCLNRDMTIVIVAHRPTTIEMCDRVLQVRGGRVIEMGERRAVSAGIGVGRLHSTCEASNNVE